MSFLQAASPSVPASALGNQEPVLLVKALLVTLPATSFLAIPFIQGSTPANLLAYMALFPLTGLLLLPEHGYAQLMRHLALLVTVVAMLFLLSRLNHINQLVTGMERLNVIDGRQVLPYVPMSTVTQSMYLLTGFVVFKLVSGQYRPAWDRWILAGAWFLVIYGFFDWGMENLLGINADFLCNRVFIEAGTFETPGSLRQHLPIMGLQVMRFKSFTGEPSMYAITALPYLYLALLRNRHRLAWLLFLSLALTMSTVAYSGLIALGLFLMFRIRLPFKPQHYILILVGLSLLVGMVFLNFDGISAMIERTFVAKLSGSDESGSARASYFRANIDFFNDPHTTWMVRLLGLGFGTIRSTDLFSTLLINIGVAGMAIVTGWFVWLVARAWTEGKPLGAALLSTLFILMMGAVPEFAYLPPWLLAGLLQAQSFQETTR